MKIEDIFKNVIEIIEESTGIEADSISLEDTLFDKLNIDSIDLVDILFEIESRYDISVKVSDLEERARNYNQDMAYEIDGKITQAGVDSIAEVMPEINKNAIKEGMTIADLIKLINVHSLCKLVQFKLDEKE